MTLLQILALVLLGFLIGNISSFFGVGGGAFLVPALVRIAKLEWEQAIALSLVQIVPTAALGAWRRYRQGEVMISLALATLGGTIPGSWLGRKTVAKLHGFGHVALVGREVSLVDACLTFAFFGFLMFMSLRMLKPDARAGGGENPVAPTADPPASPRVAPLEALLIGLAVGFTGSLLGIGGGFLFVPLAVQRFRLPVVLAVGTSLFQMPITSAFGALFYLTDTDIPLRWLIPLLSGSLVGVLQGVALSRRFNNRQYRRLLAGMLAVVAAIMLVSWIVKVVSSSGKP